MPSFLPPPTSLDTILTGAALLLAIASPLISAAITSKTQKREREATFFLQHKAEVIENYVRTTGAFLQHRSTDKAIIYGSAYSEIMLYVSDETAAKISELNNIIGFGYAETTSNEQSLFEEILQLLSKESPRRKEQWHPKHKKNK